MNDALVLSPIAMNFNPFRSTPPASKSQAVSDATTANSVDTNNVSDDSWHSNVATNRAMADSKTAAPISAPLSWFSSWTSSTTATSVVSSTIAGGSAATMRSSHETTVQTTMVVASSSSSQNEHNLPRSPSSLNMLRGFDSHESDNETEPHSNHHPHVQTSSHVATNNKSHRDNEGALARGESFTARLKTAIGANVVGVGCIPTNATAPFHNHRNSDVNGNDDLYSIIADVPFFPPQGQSNARSVDQCVSRGVTKTEQHHKPLHREEELVVDFPSWRQTNNNQASSPMVVAGHYKTCVHSSEHTMVHKEQVQQIQHHDSHHHHHHHHHHPPAGIHSLAEQEVHTFPGFALYNMARVSYILKKYTKALDTTTECLRVSKRALMIDGNNHNYNKNNNTSFGNVSTSNSRNESLSGVGFGNVRNIIKGGSVTSGDAFPLTAGDSPILVPTTQHPIVIANATAKMLSHYPTHSCVAQTLLLRARVLAVCGLYGHGSDDENDDNSTFSSGGDYSLVHQAIQHVEMAVAMQRKISTSTNVNLDLTQWELATPMVFLGVLKAEIRNFKDADGAYEEAFLLLRSIRQLHQEEQYAANERGDDTLARKHSKLLKRITREMANVLYLKGRSFQCRRLYCDAFQCYNKGLGLLRSVGVSKNDAGTKKIIRCMKKSSALEKLLSEYWDDSNRI
ncbi:hypothetical protein HJC23_006767 [Cyclotella cryptica]|uniref:Non-specific serine/threonine protein kinase n=1 Tax=Cyclotella cryptica TaxID=29204 RepID=A0ABD3NKP2_9STRA|eukprot:CCRYP_020625-RA/>CCRYP_020625-RA protein AED:0.08 eAED:0.08 QI:0/-1/0/1/-1/1/1/0/680